jgi:glycosyltransferase involved in cell wall biosynthesis
MGKVLSYIRFKIALRQLLPAVQAMAPDVIYSSQQRWDCRASTYFAQKLGKPQIIHLHYTIEPCLGDHVLQRLKTCDHVVTVSEFIRDLARKHGVPSERVTTVRNTTPIFPQVAPERRAKLRAEFGGDEDTVLVGQVSRFAARKGLEDTIRAFDLIAPCAPKSRLILVGDGPLRHDLERLAQRSRNAHRIHFAGRRSDIQDVLGAFDVFIHPSRREPFGLAVLEAGAAGLPVVAYAEGGVQEIIVPGETGLLVSPGDTRELAMALEVLLRQPCLRMAMGQANRQRVEQHFQSEMAGKQFAALVKSVATRN